MHGGTSRIRPSPFRREPGCPRLASLRRQARMPARKPLGGASELSGAGTTLLLGTESGRLRRGRHSCSERFPPEDEAKDLIAEDAVLLREDLVHLLQRFGPRSSPRWATALPARSRPGTPAGPGDHRRPYATRTDGRVACGRPRQLQPEQPELAVLVLSQYVEQTFAPNSWTTTAAASKRATSSRNASATSRSSPTPSPASPREPRSSTPKSYASCSPTAASSSRPQSPTTSRASSRSSSSPRRPPTTTVGSRRYWPVCVVGGRHVQTFSA
jgi:hypothetical protein